MGAITKAVLAHLERDGWAFALDIADGVAMGNGGQRASRPLEVSVRRAIKTLARQGRIISRNVNSGLYRKEQFRLVCCLPGRQLPDHISPRVTITKAAALGAVEAALAKSRTDGYIQRSPIGEIPYSYIVNEAIETLRCRQPRAYNAIRRAVLSLLGGVSFVATWSGTRIVSIAPRVLPCDEDNSQGNAPAA